MYRGAADLLYFCTILHFRYININIYTINFVHCLFEMKKTRRSSLCVRSSRSVQFVVSLLLFIRTLAAPIAAVGFVRSLAHVCVGPPAASSAARSASQCQSSDLYIKQTRLHIHVLGTCTEINTLY